MKTNKISAFAPATIANFNVGYDILGAALDRVGDVVHLSVNGSQENTISRIENGDGIPFNVEKNACSVVIKAMQKAQNKFIGVDIEIIKGFASGSGLGSSSASSAAAAVAYNALIGYPFSKEELVPFAALGEEVSCGSAHTDNVAPAILGGLILNSADSFIRLPIPDDLFALSFFPEVQINTSDSRRALRPQVDLKKCSQQVGYMGAFVSALYENDYERLSQSLKDLIIEPTRGIFIPQFDRMKMESKELGALAFGISGSGPSVFAICKGKSVAEKVMKAFNQLFEGSGISTQSFITPLSSKNGAKIIQP